MARLVGSNMGVSSRMATTSPLYTLFDKKRSKFERTTRRE